jgi:endonuclease G
MRFKQLLVVCAVAIVTAALGYSVLHAIGIPTGSAYTQNLDGIGTSATAALPTDFRVDKLGTARTVGSYASAGTVTALVGGANLSSTASNGVYNFGSGTTTSGPDRAIGFLSSGSGTVSGNLYAQLANNSGSGLTGLNVSYTVEKYRGGSNSAGFRIQLFYSFDGSTWLTAGPAFSTAFTPDASNSGYATAPGVTVPVDQTLTVAIPNGSAFYLAWNYSVASGSTSTNAQALAIDDVSIIGIAGPPSTAPQVTSTSPTNGAGNVPVNGTITVNFNQTVSASASAFQLSCAGTPQSFTQTASPGNTFTLTPSSPLPLAAVCTVTVVANQISEPMTADYTFSFVTPLPSANAPVVISQLYGGGGNNNAVYLNDFVELYNRGTAAVDLTGWSIQYTSAAGSSWGFNLQSLGGTIAPGQYLLIALASGGANGIPLPEANIYGQINMSATSGKLALVDTATALTDGCPLTDPHLIDFVGYGSSANCAEGGAAAPAPSNSTAILRNGDGGTDTNNNGADFIAGAPNPRQTAPFVEIGPSVVNVDPAPNTTTAPKDATMTVNFSEAVEVTDPWFDITCASGQHNDVTTAVSSGGRVHYITPNVTFTPGEKCTITIYRNQVADADLDDSAADTNNLKADVVWSFTVAKGGAPPDDEDVNLGMGNPSGADVNTPDNYLMTKPEYTLSYNRSRGRPNWVSWHLTNDWTGNSGRSDAFRPDPAIPPDWYRVQSFDFSGSGFDRGHMDPSADRTKDLPINQATFLMSNMVAQAPDNNQGPWENLESYLRSLLPGDELYIVAGPLGEGGIGNNSTGVVSKLADGHVSVPAYTWKVALVLSKMDGDDVSRIDCSTRTIAVVMPNAQGIRTSDPNDWMTYLTTVNDLQDRTGYNFFSNVPRAVQNCIEAGINGVNPKNQPAFTIDPVSIEAGTPSATISGTILADDLAPPGSVDVTFGTDTIDVPIGPDGRFTATLQTGSLAASSVGYAIGFSYAGDTNFAAASATSTLTVVDTTAPVLAGVSPTPDSLGPVNHKMIVVTVAYTATDYSGARCNLLVRSNEPVNGLGDGNTGVDWRVIDDHHVQLRSERSGTGDGRTYTIVVGCADPSGNETSASTVVVVPK